MIGGVPVGSIVSERFLKKFTKNFVKFRLIGQTGELMVCEALQGNQSDMNCLLSRDGTVKHGNLPRKKNGISLPMDYALNGGQGIIIARDYRGVEVIATYLWDAGLKKGLVLKINVGELHSTTEESLHSVILYLILLVITGWSALYWMVSPAVRRLYESERELTESKIKMQQVESYFHDLINHQEVVREEERQRIAREIHDQLGSDLTSINSSLSFYIKKLVKEGEVPDSHLVDAAKTTISAVKSMRRAINDLSPPMLDIIGVWATLRWYCDQVDGKNEISCTYIEDGEVESVGVDAKKRIVIFRCVQEAITNVMRHAQASQLVIRVSAQDKFVKIEVTDNGNGLIDNGLSSMESMGMGGIRERARFLGADLETVGTPGEGSRVMLRIPRKGLNECQ